MWVFVCVSGHPFINDCCNNRQQSCKVRGLLVNNVQNIIPQRLTANEPIAGPLNLYYLLKHDRITQLHCYTIYTTRGRSVLSALRGCSAHLWSNSEKLSSVMDGLIDSHEVWPRGKISQCLPMQMFSFEGLHFNNCNGYAHTSTKKKHSSHKQISIFLTHLIWLYLKKKVLITIF